MCDIGRFEYHWIEGDDRIVKPLARVRRAAPAGVVARRGGESVLTASARLGSAMRGHGQPGR
jgi:hypothetical protein